MPITLPNLDDRTFDDLVEEALTLIPVHAPEWTNFNDSDPGITLVQLFAYLTEMLIYRQNRISDANVCAFLKLMDGIERRPCPNKSGCVKRVIKDVAVEPELRLADEVREAVLKLRTQERAVTCEDFERLAFSLPQVKRARCVPQRDLTKETPDERRQKADGYVSVVIVPDATANISASALVKKVEEYLAPRRLLTTRVRVTVPRYLQIAVHVTLHLKPDAMQETVRQAAEKALADYFDPFVGGPDGGGWPFGRNVYVSEVYALPDRLPGVDYVARARDTKTGDPRKDEDKQPYSELTVLPADLSRGIVSADAQAFEGIRLEADELVAFTLTESHLQLMDPKLDISKPVLD